MSCADAFKQVKKHPYKQLSTHFQFSIPPAYTYSQEQKKWTENLRTVSRNQKTKHGWHAQLPL
jgi:hypothetical protein